jgi:F-type H+-transporting ATPase subunit gamma
MAGQTRAIKRRIRSVDKIRQITRAMELVATSKIKRAEDRIKATRPYAQKMVEIMTNLTAVTGDFHHPLLDSHDEIKNTAILVLTSNRGLCGAFNTNTLKKAEDLAVAEKRAGRDVKLLTVGKKGYSYFSFRGYDVTEAFLDISDAPTFEEAQMIAGKLMNMYTDMEADMVYIVFNHFKSVAEQKPLVFTLFPLAKPEEAEKVAEEEQEGSKDYLYEPDAQKIIEKLLPAYAETVTYRSLLESAASEHGARRTAMKSATDNSVDMIDSLTMSFNRARQAQITQELAEISGAVEALKYIQAKEA